MSKYIDKGTARQHLTDRLMESAFNNFRVSAYVDDVYVDIIDNRLPVWLDELPTYDVSEVRHGRWEKNSDTAFFWKCSECGAYLFWRKEEYLLRDTDEPNYCPNCGSRMDLGGDTE